ncbi:DNA utilization protein GntX [Gemmata obscuriglobus]|uniref:ComF family protein n=1 Tax=Gemmata obscuriglobus TaxID=114 RepID=A0A2Z3HA18_9BACT|nr:ComF family protein [Gemmata obscuriglobus]AWM38524.1 ComF family protein [Gemmata obscuriglobus]QEG28523.1 DNA utilization protein GntX [Gemmata obscuriglobus]VTS06590.1 phosphoribosyltransferase : Putative amidophosphoribosyltransferase OS=Singulisphaera acidiphila (strain ATCC BAA-1392 / DSM 18658 / VKM B-2454 / MOB10) GN=Sinac_3778 PE=4 SV=1: Pribosyltran [Gemmata obscuriglobus UQM 2246]
MLRATSELIRHAIGLVYPDSCLVCDAEEPPDGALRHGLCSECRRAIVSDPFPACPWCAQTVGPHADISKGCGECRGAGFAFDSAVRLGPYEGKLRDAILRMKLLSGEGLADRLGRVLVEERGTAHALAEIDTVVPVPLHWWRKWTRGYNQSEALAREIASSLGRSYEPRVLRRARFTTQHAQPTRSARLINMRDVFRVRSSARVAGKAVLLVDDVMTTGSTASVAAKALRDAGAERVVVAVLARR